MGRRLRIGLPGSRLLQELERQREHLVSIEGRSLEDRCRPGGATGPHSVGDQATNSGQRSGPRGAFRRSFASSACSFARAPGPLTGSIVNRRAGIRRPDDRPLVVRVGTIPLTRPCRNLRPFDPKTRVCVSTSNGRYRLGIAFRREGASSEPRWPRLRTSPPRRDSSVRRPEDRRGDGDRALQLGDLSVHYHALFLDGAYSFPPGRKPVFHPTPAPTDEDVARVVAAVFRRVERALADREPDAAQRRFIDSAPVLAAVAEASARGVVATGPCRGRRIIRIRGAPADVDVFVMGRLCAQVEGFNLQAATSIWANDRQDLERMAPLPRAPSDRHRPAVPAPRRPPGAAAQASLARWHHGVRVHAPRAHRAARCNRASPKGASDSPLWGAGAGIRGEVRDRACRGCSRRCRAGCPRATGRQAQKAGQSSMGVADMARVPE